MDTGESVDIGKSFSGECLTDPRICNGEYVDIGESLNPGETVDGLESLVRCGDPHSVLPGAKDQMSGGLRICT